MNCCSTPNGLDKMFNTSWADGEAKDYLRKGLDKGTRLVVKAIAAQGIAGASVLEVGSGAGGLHAELLKAGAARATSVDLSPAYLDAARRVAESLGFTDRIEHRLLDFARQADTVAEADIVVMNRVVCCYPDMPGLVAPAAARARRLLALVFPRDAWWLRLGGGLMNAWLALTRNAFRLFLHRPEAIYGVVGSHGLKPLFETFSGSWQIVIFQRRGN